MKTLRKSLLATVAGSSLLAASACMAAPVHINVSYQPTNWWALPFYLATKKHWWADVGLDVSYSTFAAGVPQIASAAAGSWDVGSTGSVPAVIGAERYHILTIGISNDESATNVLMATAKGAAAYRKDPASLKGHRILVTANSTGEYAAAACLKKAGLNENDVTMVNLGEAGIVSALSSDTAQYGALWAPFSYTLESKGGGQVICSGHDGGAMIPGALVVRQAYAEKHPQLVARYLAVYLHSVQWEKQHPAQTMKALEQADREAVVPIAPRFAKVEYQRPIFNLAQQLRIMQGQGGKPAPADVWFDQIAQFMHAKGSLPQMPAASSYITARYLRMVEADPKLRAFANDGSH